MSFLDREEKIICLINRVKDESIDLKFKEELKSKLIHLEQSEQSIHATDIHEHVAIKKRKRQYLFPLGIAISVILLLSFSIFLYPPNAIQASNTLLKDKRIIGIEFSRKMDKESVINSLSISPKTDYQLSWKGNLLQVTLRNLKPGETYRLTLENTAQSFYGRDMTKELNLFFYGPKNRPKEDLTNGLHVSKSKHIKWSNKEVKQIRDGVENGHYTSRLTPEEAAMDNLDIYLPEWSKEYKFPELQEITGNKAIVRAYSKAGNSFLQLTVERLTGNIQHGPWFLTKIEWWE